MTEFGSWDCACSGTGDNSGREGAISSVMEEKRTWEGGFDLASGSGSEAWLGILAGLIAEDVRETGMRQSTGI